MAENFQAEFRQPINASAWKQKALKSQLKATVLLDLPSGATVEACRPNLQAWFLNGRLPQHLVIKFLEASPDADPQAALQNVLKDDPTAVFEMLRTARDIVMATVVNPRIVDGGSGDDELDPSEIPDEDFFFIYQWAMSGAAGVPVETVEGAVSVGSLESFRDARSGGASVGAGDHGQ